MSDRWRRTPQAQEQERQLVLSTPRKRQAYFQESTLQRPRAERGKVESAARPARGGEESRRSPVPPRALHVSSRLLSGRAAGLTLPGGLSLSPGQATSRLRPREPPEFPVFTPIPLSSGRRLGSEKRAPLGERPQGQASTGTSTQGSGGHGPRLTPPHARNSSPRPLAELRPSRVRANGPRPPPGR